ncbi:hypothetical protein PIB30_022213 [Stylosanthes scabra]|uniref:B3 domain-containing protein n=1 Tax=Stylosanthes scabra TaxID=79078 RepID=A0ABU6Y7G0_9FABA|nr:hypothetical protein [Stylosanthes scabra]
MARSRFTFPWFQCGRNSPSSSDENKLKEPLMDADNSTSEVLPLRKRKRANAFLESEGSGDGRTAPPNEENKTMKTTKIERSCSVQENNNHQHYFNEAEIEVAEILQNLNTSFLERLNLETSNSTVTSSPSNAPRVSLSPINRERRGAVNQRNPEPELPQNFKTVISDRGGSRISLVIEKTLCASDLNRQQNRLSMPSAQIKDREFVFPAELASLDNKGEIKVEVIQPSLEISELTLVKWFMPKDNGSVSTTYVLRSNWMDVAEANELQKYDVVQVWSFRVQEQLCMAIVKL